MKRILAVAGVMVLALILMDTYQVVKAPSGLTVVPAGQVLAADLRPPPPPPPPPPPAPVGKGKASHWVWQRQSTPAAGGDQRLSGWA